jgi:hypothetical protein
MITMFAVFFWTGRLFVLLIESILVHLSKDLAFRLLSLDAQPVLDFLAFFTEVVVDVIKALIPCSVTLLFKTDNL